MKAEAYPSLLEAARRASGLAYAPYSRFHVGAAALTEAGEIVAGCNIENAAFSPSVCAERVALFSARAQGKGRIVALAVVTASGDIAAPCGVCRQVLWELARDAEIVLEDGSGSWVTHAVTDLLPHPFGKEDLETVASRVS